MIEFGWSESACNGEVQVPEILQRQILQAVRRGDLSLTEFADNKVLQSKSLLLPELLIEAAESIGWSVRMDADGLLTLNPPSSTDAF